MNPCDLLLLSVSTARQSSNVVPYCTIPELAFFLHSHRRHLSSLAARGLFFSYRIVPSESDARDLYLSPGGFVLQYDTVLALFAILRQ